MVSCLQCCFATTLLRCYGLFIAIIIVVNIYFYCAHVLFHVDFYMVFILLYF